MKFIIEGGNKLEGEVRISSSKNAVLKMLAASLLSSEKCTILNAPDIDDIETLTSLIFDLGGEITRKDNNITINAGSLKKSDPDPQLVKKLRASILFVSPLLVRFGKTSFPQPGGDLIGVRPIDTHIDALKQLGVKVSQKNGLFCFETDKLKGNRIILNEMSVSATENALMAACLAEGESEIRLAAAEPEIEDLALFLTKMGAKIEGAGTHTIKIKGVKKLSKAIHEAIPDRLEAGTFTIAAVLNRGEVKINNVRPDHLDLFLKKLVQANVNLEIMKKSILVKPTTFLKPIYIDTRPYPGFPTDLQAPTAVLLTQAKGNSLIFETLYEKRFNYAKELSKMGASIKLLDTHRLLISGPTPLFGKTITTYDIRAGATLVIAALIASGKSVIENVELIDRGYDKIDEKLKKLNAKIERR